jgi:hypothetical protein
MMTETKTKPPRLDNSTGLICHRMPKAPPAPGRYEGVPFDEYASWAAVSNSMLGRISGRNTPAHCLFWMLTRDDEDKVHYQEGRAVHAAILEPQRYARELLVLPEINKRSSTERDRREALIAANPGRIHLEQEQADAVHEYAQAAKRNKPIAACLSCPGACEVCYVWIDPVTGLTCKARIDREVGEDNILDVKTARAAAEQPFSNSIMEYGYHRQAFMYLWARKEIGLPVGEYILAALEMLEGMTASGPVRRAICASYRLGEDSVKVGQIAVRDALNKIGECVHDNHWPGPSDDLTDIDIPLWALTRFSDGV